jgi:acetoin utilization protein AcuC
VSDRVGLVRCPEARIYDHGPEHPLRPDRVLLTWDLIHAYGLDERSTVATLGCAPADDPTLELIHTPAFIDATRRAGHGEEGDWARFGYGPGDNPIFDQMHEAGAIVAGASVAAARAVWAEGCDHAFNAAGGLHHAMPDRASGFCVYNDPAIAIAWLLANGCERIAYVDVDVHHGDGVQAIFEDEPRVLTISVHESGRFLFPGTGFANEIGEGDALGTIANLPLPPSTTDDLYLPAFDAVVPKLVRAFEPEILVTQLGCDSHYTDPLAHLGLTTRAYAELAGRLHDLAHTVTNGRWLATGGGGYQWAAVVPRAWCSYLAEMLGTRLPERLPAAYLAEVSERFGIELDPNTADEVVALRSEHRARVESQVARAIEMVRGNLFPLHGLSV